MEWICISYSTLVFMKIVDGSLSMETVEEQLRELATNCIQESQGKPLTNLTW
jgi:dTMP kinase